MEVGKTWGFYMQTMHFLRDLRWKRWIEDKIVHTMHHPLFHVLWTFGMPHWLMIVVGICLRCQRSYWRYGFRMVIRWKWEKHEIFTYNAFLERFEMEVSWNPEL
jgi:hypothetical protein